MNGLIFVVVETLSLLQLNIETSLTAGLALIQTSTIAFINEVKTNTAALITALTEALTEVTSALSDSGMNSTNTGPVVVPPTAWTRVVNVEPTTDLPFEEVYITAALPASTNPFAPTNIALYVYVGNSTDTITGTGILPGDMGTSTIRIYPRDANPAPMSIYPQASCDVSAMQSVMGSTAYSPSAITKRIKLKNRRVGTKGLAVWIYDAGLGITINNIAVTYRGPTLINNL